MQPRLRVWLSAACVAALACSSGVFAQEEPAPQPPADSPPAQPPSDPPAPEEVPPAVEVPADQLPAPQELIAEALEAMGGADRIHAVTSFSLRAKIPAPLLDLSFEVQSARSGDFHLVQDMPTGGQSTVVFDGSVCWAKSEGEYKLATKDDLAQARQQFDMLFPYWIVFSPSQRFTAMKTEAREMFQGVECHRVRMTSPSDDKRQRFAFFDVAGKRMHGMRYIVPMEEKTETVDFVFGEWKDIGELAVFTKIDVTQGSHQFEVIYSDVEFNGVKPVVFDRPAEVEELLEEQGSATSLETSPAAPKPPPAADDNPTDPPPESDERA